MSPLGRPTLSITASHASAHSAHATHSSCSPFEANLLRFQGAPYVVTEGSVRNQYEVHLVKKHPEPATFRLRVSAPGRTQVLLPQAEVRLASLQGFRLPLFVTSPKGDYAGPFSFTVEVEDVETKEVRRIGARFLGPQLQR